MFTKYGANIKTSKSHIESPFSIITWNYDIQIELMIQEMFYNNSTPQYLLATTNSINRDKRSVENELSITHLNGIAGIFSGFDSESNHLEFCLIDKPHEINFMSFMGDVIGIASNFEKNNLISNQFFSFHWEKQNTKANEIKLRALDRIIKSDKLIIIGYSFPDDNRQFDEEWMSQIGSQTEIIYQDPNPEDYFIERSKKLNLNVISVPKTKTFHIAHELT